MKGHSKFVLILKNGDTKTFYYYGNAVKAFLDEYGFQFKLADEKIIKK